MLSSCVQKLNFKFASLSFTFILIICPCQKLDSEYCIDLKVNNFKNTTHKWNFANYPISEKVSKYLSSVNFLHIMLTLLLFPFLLTLTDSQYKNDI